MALSLAPVRSVKAINSYLRKLLVHGARSAVLRLKREQSPFGPWLDALERRSPVKVVITAAANRLARVAWAVLSSGEEYRPPTASMLS
jgi:transposase